ncbi:hypothetical protein BDR06DRAFT_976686 [Suillus hirtellus]|nr:hypothetical protein BDR06DRAFT_976686 [Suillus hirtellus]
MTGARVAYPLLLGLANIRMCTRTKLSSKTFLLMTLLPIPKIMISNPVGNVRHCFTPLAAYIVDTPEVAMLACVHGKTSPFTMALYLQFGDNFQHPAHTRSITLGQLAGITVNPDDLEAYFEACADLWLNGVHAPFWMDWPLADPSIFLMPESLHHWHKEFYDHNLQWCIVVVGAQELDFQFSILQPTTGYCHFSGRISKLKQVTGARMGTKRPIRDWHIPKLELLQSITSSTHKVSTLIQWSADATEHAHMSEIKEPAWQMNNNDYDPQICHHLDREEKL